MPLLIVETFLIWTRTSCLCWFWDIYHKFKI